MAEAARQSYRVIPFPSAATGPAAAAFFRDTQTLTLGMSGGFGSGKTYVFAAKGIALAMMNAGQAGAPLTSMLTEPTYGQVADVLIPTLETLLTDWGIDHRIPGVKNGWNLWLPEFHHMVLLRSADNPAHLRGHNLCDAGMDEAALCRLEAWRSISSRVRDKRARVLQRFITTTPEGLGWVYERFGTGKHKNTRLIFAPTEQNLQNLPDWFLSELKQSYDAERYRAYAEGQFVSMTEGSVFGDLFRRDTHLTGFDDDRPRRGELIRWGMDFNVDPMCAVAFQRQSDGSEVAMAELVVRGTHTEEFAKIMRERFPFTDYPDQVIHCDPTGIARHTAGSRTDVAILRDAGYRVEYRSVNQERDTINEVRRLLRDSRGDIRLRVSRSCPLSTTSLEAWAYKEGTTKTKEDEYREIASLRHVPHVADCFKYFAHNAHPITRPSVKIYNPGQ